MQGKKAHFPSQKHPKDVPKTSQRPPKDLPKTFQSFPKYLPNTNLVKFLAGVWHNQYGCIQSVGEKHQVQTLLWSMFDVDFEVQVAEKKMLFKIWFWTRLIKNCISFKCHRNFFLEKGFTENMRIFFRKAVHPLKYMYQL